VSRLLQQSVWWTAQRRQGEHTGSRRRPWCTVRCAPTACLCGRSRAWGGLLRMMADAGGTTYDDLDERVGTSRTDGAGCRRRRRRQRNTALHDTARRDTAHDWSPVEGEEMDAAAAAAEQDCTGRLRRGTSCCMSQTARFTPHASRLTLPHTHDQPATATAHRQRVHCTTTRHVREWPISTGDSDSHAHRQTAANGHHACAGCRATSELRVSGCQESASRFHEIFLSCRPSSSASIQYNPPSSLPPTFSRIPPSCCFISLSSASPTPTMLSSRLSRTVSIPQELDHSINPILTSSSDPAARGFGRPSHPRHQIALRRHVCARLRRGC
jgi:hypothetical protein